MSYSAPPDSEAVASKLFAFWALRDSFPDQAMDNFDSDAVPENEWEDRGELAWNEFDWERYFREQDEAIHRYMGFYEAFRDRPDRIDRVAEQMGWELPDSAEEASEEAAKPPVEEETPEFVEEDEVYTLHKNPVFVATKSIYLSLKRPWELAATEAGKVAAPVALSYLASLHRGEEQATQAIHALDFGDYAMAISLFKRALSALNQSLALIQSPAVGTTNTLRRYREDALPRLFDIREIWLRVINECRNELNRPVDEES